jgi:hypothetical protein
VCLQLGLLRDAIVQHGHSDLEWSLYRLLSPVWTVDANVSGCLPRQLRRVARVHVQQWLHTGSVVVQHRVADLHRLVLM